MWGKGLIENVICGGGEVAGGGGRGSRKRQIIVMEKRVLKLLKKRHMIFERSLKGINTNTPTTSQI